MRSLFRLVLFSIVIIPSFSLASGNRIGNGGKGIVCAKGGQKEIQLLDFYEATNPRKELLGLSREDAMKKVLENLDRLAPTLAKSYSKRSGEIMGEIQFKDEVLLSDTKDAQQVALPDKSSCDLKQIAIRLQQTDLLTKPWVFSSSLWNEMRPEQQAGLLMHEIIYEHLWKLGEKNSVKARKINAYLFGEKSKTDAPDDFWKIIQSMNLPIYR